MKAPAAPGAPKGGGPARHLDSNAEFIRFLSLNPTSPVKTYALPDGEAAALAATLAARAPGARRRAPQGGLEALGAARARAPGKKEGGRAMEGKADWKQQGEALKARVASGESAEDALGAVCEATGRDRAYARTHLNLAGAGLAPAKRGRPAKKPGGAEAPEAAPAPGGDIPRVAMAAKAIAAVAAAMHPQKPDIRIRAEGAVAVIEIRL